MSQLAKALFDGLKEMAQGVGDTLVNDVLPDLAAETKRLGTQGCMELAAGLFNENSFVPYGPGQYTPQPQQEQTHEQQHCGMER